MKISSFFICIYQNFVLYLSYQKKTNTMALTLDNIYFKWFWKSLREDQQKDYREMSINQQKDWYISYLESHYSVKK